MYPVYFSSACPCAPARLHTTPHGAKLTHRNLGQRWGPDGAPSPSSGRATGGPGSQGQVVTRSPPGRAEKPPPRGRTEPGAWTTAPLHRPSPLSPGPPRGLTLPPGVPLRPRILLRVLTGPEPYPLPRTLPPEPYRPWTLPLAAGNPVPVGRHAGGGAPTTRKRGRTERRPKDGVGGGREQRQAEPAGRAETASASDERRGAAAPVPPLGPEGARPRGPPPQRTATLAERPSGSGLATCAGAAPGARTSLPGARTSLRRSRRTPPGARTLLHGRPPGARTSFCRGSAGRGGPG